MVFALISHSGITLTLYSANGETSECTHSTVDLINDISQISDYEVWFKPLKWNEGGYDGIFIDKKMVMFVLF